MPAMKKLVAPTAVEVTGEHKLRVTFKDGLIGDIDFAGRHWRGVSAPLADPAFFAQARIDPAIRTVAWPNGFDMAPETLYERASEHQVRAPAHAAA
jgi:Protein of unknown function (DUF2442)